MKIKTLIPTDRLPFNEWCKLFNVSRLYVDRTGINNAQKIMELWNGYSGQKEIFIDKIKVKENE